MFLGGRGWGGGLVEVKGRVVWEEEECTCMRRMSGRDGLVILSMGPY